MRPDHDLDITGPFDLPVDRRHVLAAGFLLLALVVFGGTLGAGASAPQAGRSAAFGPTPTATSPPTEWPAFLPIVENCQNLYFDDFSNANSGWPVADTGSVFFHYLAGEYSLLLRNTNWWAGATSLKDFNSYLLQAKVRNTTGKDGSYGLLFGRKFGWVGFYTFEVSPNGNYVMWRYDGNGNWVLLDFGFSSAIKQGTAVNMLAVERNGSGIQAFVNGVEVINLTDSKHLGLLGVGITATSFGQANLDVRFDDYTVLPIGCGLSVGEQLLDAAPPSTGPVSPAHDDWQIRDNQNDH